MIHIFPNEEKKYSKLLTNKIVALKQNEETSLYIVEKKHKIRIFSEEEMKGKKMEAVDMTTFILITFFLQNY